MKHTKDSRDQFYRRAKEDGWRARSAYKLLQLDEAYDLFGAAARQAAAAAASSSSSSNSRSSSPCCHAVDLCAAPGSWSQVLSRRLYLPALRNSNRNNANNNNDEKNAAPPLPRLVSVDLQPMAAVEGVAHLQGDITSARTAAAVVAALGGNDRRAAIVVCDGAPDVTGLHDQDGCAQLQLVGAAAGIAAAVLAPGGAFVAKVFVPPSASRGAPVRGGEGDADGAEEGGLTVEEKGGEGWAGLWLLAAQLRLLFRDVALAKPRASRGASAEHFAVCRGFTPPARVGRDWLRATLAGAGELMMVGGEGEKASAAEEEEEDDDEAATTVVRRALGFYACGDLSAWDDDGKRRTGGGGEGDEAGSAFERALMAG
jgi:tRNA (cytidine32/guanosine34-2'-O)-methyltransferase